MARRASSRPRLSGAVSRFDHVGLNVADLDTAVDWYCSAFDLKESMRFRIDPVALDGVMLTHTSGWRLELLHRPSAVPGICAANPADAALTLGYSHFALQVPSVQETYDALLAAGAADRMSPRPSPDPSGLPMAFVADPWENLIELLER
jgi:glyoxylase I family protein